MSICELYYFLCWFSLGVVVFRGRVIRDLEPNEHRRTLVGELSQCATWASSDSDPPLVDWWRRQWRYGSSSTKIKYEKKTVTTGLSSERGKRGWWCRGWGIFCIFFSFMASTTASKARWARRSASESEVAAIPIPMSVSTTRTCTSWNHKNSH